MAATYTNITLEEMWDFLTPQGFRTVDTLLGVKETVFSKRVDTDGHKLSLRVYTGINPNGNSRDVGTDAIRCAIFWLDENGQIKKIASSKRVHRVAGWRENLQDRLDHLTVEAKCECGAPMVRRKNKAKKSEFFGCANFPECRNTKEIK